MNIYQSGVRCPRCAKRVYFAEEIIAMGKHWHKSCFTCANESCKRRLDSRTCTDREGEAYCTHCYGKLFGPKGYGYGQGAGILSMDTGLPPSKTPEPDSVPNFYSQAQVAPLFGDVSNEFYPQTGDARRNHAIQRHFGKTERCTRCSKPVYMAEKVMAAGSAWHKNTCFICSDCGKNLQSTTLCEREGDILCQTCYSRNYGPKGYGFGGGAGTLLMRE